MKKLSLLLILALAAIAADKPSITDTEKAEYWQLMTRATAASLKVSNLKEQARKAIEQAEAEAAKVNSDVAASYQKLTEKWKAKGCVVEQTETDIKCSEKAPEKK